MVYRIGSRKGKKIKQGREISKLIELDTRGTQLNGSTMEEEGRETMNGYTRRTTWGKLAKFQPQSQLEVRSLTSKSWWEGKICWSRRQVTWDQERNGTQTCSRQGIDTSRGRSLRLALHSPTNSFSNVDISHCNRLFWIRNNIA